MTATKAPTKTVYEPYSLDSSLAEFFSQTSANRGLCDAKATELTGFETIAPVEVQGVCSYTVYAGSDYVVQFRLRSLKLEPQTAKLAQTVYGALAPSVEYHGTLGDDGEVVDGHLREPLLVYVMTRVHGISHLDFILARQHLPNSEESSACRANLLTDIARFMALSWDMPQEVSQEVRDNLRRGYIADLNILLSTLPGQLAIIQISTFRLPQRCPMLIKDSERFHPLIQECIYEIDSVMSLPMVLLHRDFGTSNILVDAESCHLTGVIDWAEAEICPFGQNLHSLAPFTGSLHLKNGWTCYEDYEALQNKFWSTFRDEIGGWSDMTRKSINNARVLGLLLSRGFTKRLANMAPPTPIRDDDSGRYNMLYLDGLLLNPSTRFVGA